MPDVLQLRGGTTSAHGGFAGTAREVTVDTDKNAVVVHDGGTTGGHPHALEGHAHTGSDITDLAAVATSGDYADLSNTPAVPGALSDLDDAAVTGPAAGEVLRYDGAYFVNAPPGAADVTYDGSTSGLAATTVQAAVDETHAEAALATDASLHIPHAPAYTVSGLPGAGSHTNGIVWCSDGDAGSPCLAVSDGTDWLRVSPGAAVSTT